jgi:hypothetical protein
VAPDEPPTTRHSTRERDEFPDFYADCDRAGTLFLVPGERPMPPVTVRVVARGPVKSKGPEAINRQLDTFKAAIEASGAAVEEAFVPVLAPGWLDHFIFNEYYQSEDESSSRSPTRWASNTVPSWRRASFCRSTIRACRTGGT